MPQRYFTVAEANQLIPHLEAAFGRILRLRAQLRLVARGLEDRNEPLGASALIALEGELDEPPAPSEKEGDAALAAADVTRRRGHARALLETLDEEMEALDTMCVEVKDLDTGLCDFVSRREGRDVLLCWRLGEKQVAFDKGNEYIRFSGVVNPDSILNGNQVSSTQVADARLEYRSNNRIDPVEVASQLGRFFLSVIPF